jgi:hypothetical protein
MTVAILSGSVLGHDTTTHLPSLHIYTVTNERIKYIRRKSTASKLKDTIFHCLKINTKRLTRPNHRKPSPVLTPDPKICRYYMAMATHGWIIRTRGRGE